MVLSGGADAPISLGIVKGFILMKILTDSWNHAPERGSRPFSVDRDGFVVAEGAWMFVLEEYEHARARGAKILAEISGYGSTCEAFHRVRLQECGEEPARAIGLAMKEAGIGANDVHYVNLHGTSTQLNDRIETRALKLVLGEHAGQVPMSALKSQIGHPQGRAEQREWPPRLSPCSTGRFRRQSIWRRGIRNAISITCRMWGGKRQSSMRCATALLLDRRTRRWC